MVINFSLVVAGTLLAVVALEIALRLTSQEIPDKQAEDQILLYKYLPGGEIDENGFRNPVVLENYAIVAMGDSQTYGCQTTSQQAWPKQLGKILGLDVYNMSVGGYGAVQYSALLNKAISFNPQIIIWGLYLGNDIFDAYYLPYEKNETGHWTHLLDEAIKKELTENPLAPFPYDEVLPKPRFKQLEETESIVLKVRVLLRNHFKLYAFLGDRTRAWREKLGLVRPEEDIKSDHDQQWAQENPGLGFVYDVPKIGTVFTPKYRSTVLDANDIRIAEGLRITLDLIGQAQEKLEERGINFLVVIIPTKETVYSEKLAKEKLSPPAEYQKLISNEHQIKTKILNFLEAKNIYHFDILPALQDKLNKNIAIYPHYHDGHPVATGYAALAASVANFLKEKGLSTNL